MPAPTFFPCYSFLMKYVIIIPDGAADLELEQLEAKTPLEAAETPYLDRLGERGRQGTVVTTPKRMPCGSDVCTMSLLGYDPARFHTGRAPLEAAALGINLDPTDWVFRVNLITVVDGCLQDHSAGHISSEEGRRLLSDFSRIYTVEAMDLYPGVSYRNIMLDRSATRPDIDSRDWSQLATIPPHDVPGEPIFKHMPVGRDNLSLLRQLVAQSEVLFANHEVNLVRRETGELPATHLWPWGQGRRPSMPLFADRFGLNGAMITAVDLLAGLAQFIGWDRLEVPGQSSYHDNDYAATGQYAAAALDDYDIVCVHVESPDEASHAGDAVTKVAAIEAIDQHVVGPIMENLQQRSEPWRVLVLPDHYTLVDSRVHDPTPVPFLICGEQVHSVRNRPLTERNAKESDLHITYGHELMEYFLRSGMK